MYIPAVTGNLKTLLPTLPCYLRSRTFMYRNGIAKSIQGFLQPLMSSLCKIFDADLSELKKMSSDDCFFRRYSVSWHLPKQLFGSVECPCWLLAQWSRGHARIWKFTFKSRRGEIRFLVKCGCIDLVNSFSQWWYILRSKDILNWVSIVRGNSKRYTWIYNSKWLKMTYLVQLK
jgi:hypothetical protein